MSKIGLRYYLTRKLGHSQISHRYNTIRYKNTTQQKIRRKIQQEILDDIQQEILEDEKRQKNIKQETNTANVYIAIAVISTGFATIGYFNDSHWKSEIA